MHVLVDAIIQLTHGKGTFEGAKFRYLLTREMCTRLLHVGHVLCKQCGICVGEK